MLFEKQQYQQDCVDNIIHAVEGIKFAEADFTAMAENLKELVEKNPTHRQFSIQPDRKRLDILMETGTGKTFTYLQAMLELNKRRGLKKFIIVLPRVAIKQGVIQNIRLTDEYFFNLYKQHINFIDYPNDGLSQIQSDFIDGYDLCVLITTNSAFNSEKNNINKRSEMFFQHGSAWNGIASCKPVVIIDEPHLLKGSETQKGLDKLTDSLMIRFGATFPKEEANKLSNVAYVLDSISAFNQYLVKRIGVSTVYAGNQTDAVAISNIRVQNKCFDFCFSRDGQPRKATLYRGDDVGAKSGLDSYAGKTVTRISSSKVALSNGQTLQGKIDYVLDRHEIRLMVHEAIKRHFAKEERLFRQGIKALALFFIPQIRDFRGEQPRIKTIFEEEYQNLRQNIIQETTNADYRAWLERDYDDNGRLRVHQGYFSGDRGNSEERERQGIDLILNDKEKLLSLDTSLRFVFSVWALQEGWDNPNIFTICKLQASHRETTRRQQVGRGLRLAVNQEGKRLTENYMKGDESAFYAVNTLDMVVSGKEHTFIHQIQNEINEASHAYVGEILTLEILKEKGLNDAEAAILFSVLSGKGILNDEGEIQIPIIDFMRANRPLFKTIDNVRYAEICSIFNMSHRPAVNDNNRRKRSVNVRRGQWQEFKEFWELINRKAKIVYRHIHEEQLITSISSQFNEKEVPPDSAYARDEWLDTHENAILSNRETRLDCQTGRPFDPVQFASELVQKEDLPVAFVCKLLSRLKRKWFINDRVKARKNLLSFIRENIHAGILQGIEYQFTETSIYPNSLQNRRGSGITQLPCTELGMMTSDADPPPNFLYDRIVFDSAIEQQAMTSDPKGIDDCSITVFAKLPRINIPTPYKSYNPDFAYLVKKPGGQTLYLVVETKGYQKEEDIPEDERHKISYGQKFFEKLDNELPDKKVVYKTRINHENLHELLRSVSEDG
ncbi:MAG: DEAD/DEAH box helicase family protein [Gammaproteobacteria bacterium]|nr:DEAD/DEAH box helicase family protein [Gammaproteobacteria bacterium]